MISLPFLGLFAILQKVTMSLPQDIEQRVRTESGSSIEEMLVLLEDFATRHPNFGDRVLRCLVFMSNGRPDQLRASIQRAESDWRDIIVAAEYEPRPGSKPWQGDWVQVRDLNLPFE